MLTSVRDVIKEDTQARLGRGPGADPRAKPKKGGGFLSRKSTKVAATTGGKFLSDSSPTNYKVLDITNDTTHLGSVPDHEPCVLHGCVSVLGTDHLRSNIGNEDAAEVVMDLLAHQADDDPVLYEDMLIGHRRRRWNYFAVFDGHGGGACSSHASKTMHTHVASMLARHAAPDREPGVETVCGCLERAFFDTEQTFVRWARSNADYSGACALAVVMAETDMFVANAGDCAGVMLLYDTDGSGKPTRAFSVNTRHTARNKSERARVAKAGGFFRDDRVNGVLEPTRSLGDIDMKGKTPTGVIATPEVKHFTIDPTKPWVLLLATDGLWDYATITDIITTVPGPLATEQQAKGVAGQLMQMALRGGSADDVTVLVVAGMAGGMLASRSTP